MTGRRRGLVDDRHDGPSLWIPEAVAIATEELLRSYGGAEDHEGIVYWAGVTADCRAIVLTAASPTANTSRGSFATGVRANTDLVIELDRRGLHLVAQAHSHPGPDVCHSRGDDSGALVKYDGFWSLVVPNYAKQGLRDMRAVGVHLFQGHGFRRLSAASVAARVRVFPTAVDLR